MKPTTVRAITLPFVFAVGSSLAWAAEAQDAKAPYPSMAPLEEYLMEKNAEIALARSAAPESVSRDAEVLVLERSGYKTAVKGKNGFVCYVERSWVVQIEDPEFWSPKMRSPICSNAAAVRSHLPLTIRKTELVLAGRTKTQMVESIKTALDRKELPTPETGAMCYMMSKAGHLNDRDGHWHPHVMFYAPEAAAESWGADVLGSPISTIQAPSDRVTMFMIPVAKWSDGTPDSARHEAAQD